MNFEAENKLSNAVYGLHIMNVRNKIESRMIEIFEKLREFPLILEWCETFIESHAILQSRE